MLNLVTNNLNTNILNKDVQDFINKNLQTDITKLVLKGSPFLNVSIQEIAAQIISKNKCKKKLPTWFSCENIYYPNKLNIEQTSSEVTAKYKSTLVSGNSLIDLTGGFGVDTFYFSQVVEKITHCELNEDLSEIVSHNFKKLNLKSIDNFSGNGLEYLENSNSYFDWVYVDPSRRNDVKGKVFLLQDCIPNIPEHIDFLFNKTEHLLIKTSPILDISSALNELKFVKEVNVVAVENEVKELLFVLENNFDNPIHIKTTNILKTKQQTFNFEYLTNFPATFSEPKKYLYEPNSAILKSGGFNQISCQLNIDKLHQNSHLYTSEENIDFPGRKFEILNMIPYDRKQLKKLIPSKKANITTRNFPETVAQIRKKTKLKDGGNSYLFFTTNINNKHIILICKKLNL